MPLLLGGLAHCSDSSRGEQGEQTPAKVAQALCGNLKLTASTPGPVPFGSSLTLTASASCGGETPEYLIRVRRGPDLPWTTISDWGTTSTVTWTPDPALGSGQYQTGLAVRTVGQVTNVNITGDAVYVGDVCTAVALTVPGGAPPLGSSIPVVATATCVSNAPRWYRFSYRGSIDSAFTIFQDWSNSSSANWNTQSLGNNSGSYEIRVHVLSSLDNHSEATKVVNQLVGNVCPTLGPIAVSLAKPQPIGTQVSLSVEPTCVGSTVPEVQYLYRLAGATKYTVLFDWGPSTRTWDTTCFPSGDYTLAAYVRGTNNFSVAEARRTTGYQLTGTTPSSCSGSGSGGGTGTAGSGGSGTATGGSGANGGVGTGTAGSGSGSGTGGCIPVCAGKQCGDDLADSCGGQCPSPCGAGTGGTSGTGGAPSTGGAAPIPSLEIVTSPAGTIPASSGVQNGVYNYTIPIKVPDGIQGLTPQISLRYSSHTGNGPLGVGWTLAATSFINRCNHNVASDGYASEPDFNNDHTTRLNKYCLDGKKLVPIGRPSDTEVDYQLETGTDAVRIRAVFANSSAGDPSYFVVNLKDGDLRFYGFEPGSTRPADATTAFTQRNGTAVPITWYLARSQRRLDLRPPIMRYFYERDLDANGVPSENRYLSTIHYGYRLGADGSPSETPTRIVRFVWQSRPDSIAQFSLGSDLSVHKRLQRVEVYTEAAEFLDSGAAEHVSPVRYLGGPNAGASFEVMAQSATASWQYLLTYTQSAFTNRSELSKIYMPQGSQGHPGPPESLPPTTFRWNAPTASAWRFKTTEYELGEAASAPQAIGTNQRNRLIVADFNGDGRDDVLYAVRSLSGVGNQLFYRSGTSQGLGPESEVTTIFQPNTDFSLDGAFAADIDGNGVAELFVLAGQTLNQGLFAGPYPAIDAPFAVFSVTSGGSSIIYNYATLMTLLRNERHPIHFDVDLQRTVELPTSVGPNTTVPVAIADFNGDGVIDVWGGASLPAWPPTAPQPGVGIPGEDGDDGDAPHIFLSNPTRSLQFTRRPEKLYGGVPGDVDGDGAAEWISTRTGPFAGLPVTRTYYGSESGTCGPLCWWSASNYFSVTRTRSPADWRVLQDINGDGVDDVVDFWPMAEGGLCGRAPTGPAVQYRFRMGNGLWDADASDLTGFVDRNFDRSPAGCIEDRPSNFFESVRFGDFDGDGTSDLLFLNPSVGLPSVNLDAVNGSSGATTDVVAYSLPPVVVMSSTGMLTQFPTGGARLRQLAATCMRRDPTGLGWERTPGSTCAHEGNADWNMAQVGDIDGDDNADLIQFVTINGQTKLETITTNVTELGVPHTRDLVVEVRNGLQQGTDGPSYSETIEYASLPAMVEAGVYGCSGLLSDMPGSTVNRTVCPKKGPLLVTRFTESGRSGSARAGVRYAYDTAVADLKGRGMLGFKRVVALDEAASVRVQTARDFTCTELSLHDQDFGLGSTIPEWATNTGYTCYASEETVITTHTNLPQSALTNDPRLIGLSPMPLYWRRIKTDNELVTATSNGTTYTTTNVFQIRQKHSEVAERYIPDATDARMADPVFPELPVVADIHKTVDYQYDSFNNLWLTTTSTAGGISDAIEITRWNQMPTNGLWVIGLPEEITHTRSLSARTETRKTLHHYRDDGQLEWTSTEPEGTPDLHSLVRYSYEMNSASPAAGNLTGLTVEALDLANASPASRTTSFGYDDHGIHITSITNAVGVTTFSFNPSLDALARVLDPNGVSTDLVVDGYGRTIASYPQGSQAEVVKAAPLPAGGVRKTSYRSITAGPEGCDLIQNSRCFSELSETLSDAGGRVTSEIQAWPDGTRYQVGRMYDGIGRTVATSRPALLEQTPGNWTQYGYDESGRVTVVSHPDNTFETRQYPSLFETRYIDQSGNLTETFIDVDGRKIGTVEFLAVDHAVHTILGYDGLGGLFDNPTTITRSARGETRVTDLSYDVLGRQTSVTDANAGTGTAYADFDGFGQVWRTRDPLQTRTFRHDSMGRLTSTTDGTGDGEVFEWDTAIHGKGRLASAARTPDNVTRSYEYDPFGRVQFRHTTLPDTATGAPRTFTIHETYDSEGRALGIEYPDAAGNPDATFAVSHAYERTYLKSVHLGANQLWALTSASPLALDETFGDNSFAHSTFDVVTARLNDITTTLAGGAADTIGFSYFPNGDVKTRTRAGRTESMRYDGLGRLTHWTKGGQGSEFEREYAYDDFGTLTGTTTRDTANANAVIQQEVYSLGAEVGTSESSPYAVSSFNGNTYTYDELGRRTRQQFGAGTQRTTTVTSYNHWDLPRATATTGPSGQSNESFRYDAFGERAYRAVNGIETYYIDDDLERRVEGTSTERYLVHVRAGGRLVAEVTRSSSVGSPGTTTSIRYPHEDDLGSVTMTTSSTGPRINSYYEPFGALVTEDGLGTGTGPGISRDFTGHERDGALINMRGRLYDPVLRRFTTPDPIVTSPASSQGHNPYSYVTNNPFRYTDPTGLYSDNDRTEAGTKNPHPESASGVGSPPAITAACAIKDECVPTGPTPAPPPPPVQSGTIIISGDSIAYGHGFDVGGYSQGPDTTRPPAGAGDDGGPRAQQVQEGPRAELIPLARLPQPGEYQFAQAVIPVPPPPIAVAGAGAAAWCAMSPDCRKAVADLAIKAAQSGSAAARSAWEWLKVHAVNKVGPDPAAEGAHTVPKRDAAGKVTGYTEFDAEGNPVKRFRGEGKPHGGVEPPLILVPKAGKGPGSPLKVPRQPDPGELPPGY